MPVLWSNLKYVCVFIDGQNDSCVVSCRTKVLDIKFQD